MNFVETSPLPSIRILNRFYAVFTVYCLLLLCIGGLISYRKRK